MWTLTGRLPLSRASALLLVVACGPATAGRLPRPLYEPPDPSPFAGAVNLFAGKVATATGQWSDRAAAYAVDGLHDDPNAHWAAENLPQSLTVDTGAPTALNAIRLWMYWADGRAYAWHIDGSLDGASWKPLAPARGLHAPATPSGEIVTFPRTTLRYVRVTVTESTRGSESGAHIVEVEGYDADESVTKTLSPDAWDGVSAGLHGAVGTKDVRYPRNVPPQTSGSLSWSADAWRGERVNAQFVLWSREPLRQLRLQVTPRGANALPSSAVSARFVRYVLADAVLVGDIIDDAAGIDTPADSTRPVWVTVDVPRNAKPGRYAFTVTATAAGGRKVSFDCAVNVLSARLTLPPPSKWGFYLDLWQNPYAVARYHNVKLWSPEHFALLEPHLRLLADAGAKPLTTTIVWDPWGGQTYDRYDTMVEWIRKPDGSFRYDYSVFDRYVEFGRRCGLVGAINAYSMVPWTSRVRYVDEVTGDYGFLELRPGQASFEAIWGPFLTDFAAHLKAKCWLGSTYIAMDERPLELMRPTVAIVRKYAPGLKVALAGSREPELAGLVDDWCSFIEPPADPQLVAARVAQGKPTTYYVCTGPEVPNTFTYSPPAESVWIPLFAEAKGFNGFLRWAYDSWTADPLWDTKHVTWQAGDAFLVYPNARPGVRFALLREGIQEVEKIHALRALARAKGRQDEMKPVADALAKFTVESVRAEGAAAAVNELRDAVLRVANSLTAR